MTEPATAIVLYRLPPAFGLPSLSVACVQVEAYLRLAKLPFAVQDCTAPSASPTGQVPALDTSADLVGAEVSSAVAAPLAEFGAARQMLDYIEEKMVDLDRHLSVSQRAEATAFTALVEAKLQPAIVYTTWVEADAFSQHTCAAYGGGMPFPLSYFMPRSQRRAVQRHFAATPSAQVYQGAADALDALAIRLSANASATSAGDFFFGSQPSSLDALLYSCLAYLRAAPVVHPQLQRKLAGHRVLTAYCDRVSQLADFDSTVPAAADANLGWSAWGGGTTDDQFSKAKSEQESELQRKGRRWLACAAAAIAAYVFLSGQYYPFSIERFGYYEDLEEEEEEH